MLCCCFVFLFSFLHSPFCFFVSLSLLLVFRVSFVCCVFCNFDFPRGVGYGLWRWFLLCFGLLCALLLFCFYVVFLLCVVFFAASISSTGWVTVSDVGFSFVLFYVGCWPSISVVVGLKMTEVKHWGVRVSNIGFSSALACFAHFFCFVCVLCCVVLCVVFFVASISPAGCVRVSDNGFSFFLLWSCVLWFDFANGGWVRVFEVSFCFFLFDVGCWASIFQCGGLGLWFVYDVARNTFLASKVGFGLRFFESLVSRFWSWELDV